MKKFILSALPLFLIMGFATAQKSLKKLWSTDTLLQVPESVLFDEKENCLWVSCINGKPGEKDGKGSIAQLKTDGRIIDIDWISGLNAPKGMARHGKYLYVADLTNLVIIDIGNRKIEKTIPIDSALFLNDVTANSDGIVYISDSKTGKIHQYKDGKTTVFLEKINRPNGLLALGSDLWVLASGELFKVKSNKEMEKIAIGMDVSTDGIEQISPGEFLVSCWSGVVYHVTDKGVTTILLDTRIQKSNTADIGFDPTRKIVFVPTFFKNTVVAYQLN
jgi:sugar lactone lactonase YvrE